MVTEDDVNGETSEVAYTIYCILTSKLCKEESYLQVTRYNLYSYEAR